MSSVRKLTSGAILLIALLVLVLAFGCGSAHHELVLQQDYVPKAGSTVEVGSVANATGKAFDIDIATMFRDALVNAFTAEGMAPTSSAAKLMTNCRILTYDKGDAFKRWLMPGWGATELTIQCDLLDASRRIGNINAKRTVDGGGLYTVGAWKNVFLHVASDVAQDIKEKINGSGDSAGSESTEPHK